MTITNEIICKLLCHVWNRITTKETMWSITEHSMPIIWVTSISMKVNTTALRTCNLAALRVNLSEPLVLKTPVSPKRLIREIQKLMISIVWHLGSVYGLLFFTEQTVQWAPYLQFHVKIGSGKHEHGHVSVPWDTATLVTRSAQPPRLKYSKPTGVSHWEDPPLSCHIHQM